MKALADGINIICVFGKDIESNASLFESAIRDVQIGLIFMHMILLNRCMWQYDAFLISINAGMIVFCLIVNLMFRGYKVSSLSSLVKSLKGYQIQKPTSIENSYWLYNFCHPFIKKLPNFPYVIKELNSDHDGGLPTTICKGLMDGSRPKTTRRLDLRKILKVEDRGRQLNRSQSVIVNQLEHNKEHLIIDIEQDLFDNYSDRIDSSDDDLDNEGEKEFNMGTLHGIAGKQEEIDDGDRPVIYGSFSIPYKNTLDPIHRRKSILKGKL